MTQQRFNTLMNAYADSFSSSQMIDSIQSGHYGRIAVAMMFFGGNNLQQLVVPWMSIGNAQDAATFGELVTQAVRPISLAGPNITNALAAATNSFGTETGAAENGYQSAVQIVEIASVRRPAGNASGVSSASDAALAKGLDVINSIALGNASAATQAFYAANVVGSTISGVEATATSSGFNASLQAILGASLSETVGSGALVSNVAAVPEPASHLALLSGLVLLFIRRRA